MKKIDATKTDDCWLVGQLLAATPLIQDGFFNHSLVLMCEHYKEGAMGLMINKELRTVQKLEVLTKLGIKVEHENAAEVKMFLGGPLDPSRGFVIHSDDYSMENTVNYGNGVCVTSEKKVLQDYVEGKGPKKLMLALGYSSWVSGQLEEEIKDNAWLTLPASSKLLFETENDSKWQKAISGQGIDIYNLSTNAGNA